MDEKISKLFLPLLDKLYNQEPAGEPFRQPVDPVKYGCYDYYLYVKHPIDLSTIKHKVLNHQYKGDAWRLIADVQLMFSNAYLFNKRGTPVWEYTNKLSKIWYADLNNVMQRLSYCCGTLHKFGPQLLFCLGTTPDRYCQIAIGAKYKCYQDSFSFCLPCFNKITEDTINVNALTCETIRMQLPTRPVKKNDFIDCTNDHWQYETFIQCTQCSKRIHQICDLYPASEDEVANCVQHEQIEQEHREQSRVPPEFERFAQVGETVPLPAGQESRTTTKVEKSSTISTTPNQTTAETTTTKKSSRIQSASLSSNHYQRERVNPNSEDEVTRHAGSVDQCDDLRQKLTELQHRNRLRALEPIKFDGSQSSSRQSDQISRESERNEADSRNGGLDVPSSGVQQNHASLDDELLQFARSVEDSQWGPSSPNPDENVARFDSAKEIRQREIPGRSCDQERPVAVSRGCSNFNTCSSSNSRNSVDNIAARLSINKLGAESHYDENQRSSPLTCFKRDKYVCNQCYRRERLGFNLRHRKFSARRLPHTRMSRYLEIKVNEYIRDNSSSAGEMTIRVLTAYRDKCEVKPEMREYLKRCRAKDHTKHPNIDEYPESFDFTTRAIFAWQEIDGVDVCVFGMHVQEYGEDCPEPNRQVVYLSYLDSVHFFRPKQFRTAVYHEILLSYFKYAKKLGFRRVFIWVCPSRKGDDYIFYRHPSEQKMPTLKRLSDWYVSLLDKGVVSGIVERHQNVYEYAMSENWTSLLGMPYLSGDYWPGEFERLLKTMIESQRIYDEKLSQKQEEIEQNQIARPHDITEFNHTATPHSSYADAMNNRSLEQHNILSLSSLYQRVTTSQAPKSSKIVNSRNSIMNSMNLKPVNVSIANISESGDYNSAPLDDGRFFEPYTPSSTRSDDLPLDLSKTNSTASPESLYDEDQVSDASYKDSSSKKKRRKTSSSMGYTKKRTRASQGKSRASQPYLDGSKYMNGSQKTSRSKSSSKDPSALESLMSPEEEMIKNLEKSLKRQKEGFIVVRLSECDCSPHFETQRRREEVTFTCELMKGREPFLQLARLKNYEFSTLRRAKFSSLAMIQHLAETFKLDPICNECYSFDSSKRHYTCPNCKDYYLCTSCHENTQHEHLMYLMAPSIQPDIDEFLQQCSVASATNSISSASSTMSNKSFNDTSLEIPTHSSDSPPNKDITTEPLHRQLTNTVVASSSMPLSCKRQRNRDLCSSRTRAEDEENANIKLFASNNKLGIGSAISPPPSHSSGTRSSLHVELDQVLIENFIRHAELNYDVDFDEMKGESLKLLTHYWSCPVKETCSRCKFVVLSCSFMGVLMKSSRLQMLLNCPSDVTFPSNGGANTAGSFSSGGINLSTNRRFT